MRKIIDLDEVKYKKLCKERNLKFVSISLSAGNYKFISFIHNKNERIMLLSHFENNLKFHNFISADINSTIKWIEQAKKIHPEYSYTKTYYVDDSTPICITCHKHGDFVVGPKIFIKKDYRCPYCKLEDNNKKVLNESVSKAIELYNGFYQYDTTTYDGVSKNMRMICPKHGEFWLPMSRHLAGCKCEKCSKVAAGKKRRIGITRFLQRANNVHNNKYDYTKVKFNLLQDKIIINCPIHGEFEQTVTCHLLGQGCPDCSGRKRKTTEKFIEESNKVHNNKYDYSKVEYVNNKTKVCITCHEKNEFGEEHGDFWQIAKHHLEGHGCPKCSNSFMDKELFIKRSNKIHDNQYDYSKVIYRTNHDKVEITCSKHGSFLMTPNCHLLGQGCPLCKESQLERKIRIALKENNINYLPQHRFDWLRNKDTNYKLSLDFYLPDYNIAIECQGEQHFIDNYFKSKCDAQKRFEDVQRRDEIKKLLCKENNVGLIYFMNNRFTKFMTEKDIYFTDIKDLVKYIRNYHIFINRGI